MSVSIRRAFNYCSHMVALTACVAALLSPVKLNAQEAPRATPLAIHGGNRWADGSITNLNPERDWRPQFGDGTTSYHHPLYYPLGDGRIFLRQLDGIYCWDLRKDRVQTIERKRRAQEDGDND